jgi:hypothetical protein
VDPILRKLPVRSFHLYGLSLGSVGLCIVLWIRAKTIGEDERGNAERRALFVGLWPPLLWLLGDTLGRREERVLLKARRRVAGWRGSGPNRKSRPGAAPRR